MAPPANAAGDARALLRDQVIAARRRSHQVYLALALFLIATVVTGFWPSYFSTLLSTVILLPGAGRLTNAHCVP